MDHRFGDFVFNSEGFIKISMFTRANSLKLRNTVKQCWIHNCKSMLQRTLVLYTLGRKKNLSSLFGDHVNALEKRK